MAEGLGVGFVDSVLEVCWRIGRKWKWGEGDSGWGLVIRWDSH